MESFLPVFYHNVSLYFFLPIFSVVEYLLGLPGLDVNLQDSDVNGGESALHAAANQDILRLLLESGHEDLDVNARNSEGRSPIMKCVQWGDLWGVRVSKCSQYLVL